MTQEKQPKELQTEIDPPEETRLRGVYRARDIADDVQELWQTGIEPGELPGWACLDELYRVKRQYWTVVSGIPSHGKSTWLDNLMRNLARTSDWRFLICSPENQPLKRHIASLIEIHSGKKFCHPDQLDPRHVDQALSGDELGESFAFIDEHFYFVQPEETDFHIDYILELAHQIKEEWDFDGMVLDPYNRLEHRRPNAMTETEYIGQVLTKWTNFHRGHNTHGWLVAHPAKQRELPNTSGEPRKQKIYAMPSLYDISGSANWYNMPDLGVVVYRNKDKKPETTTISVQKVRFREFGTIGEAELHYDTLCNRFVEHEVELLFNRIRNNGNNY
jgi:twinkle protein